MRLVVLFAVVMSVVTVEAQTRRRPTLPAKPLPAECTRAQLDEGFILDVELDDEFLYYGDDFGFVYRLRKSGGTPEELGRLIPEQIAGLIVSDATTLYVMSFNETGEIGAVWSLPKTGGVPVQLASAIVNPFDFHIDSTFLYWVSLGSVSPDDEFRADGKIEKIAKNGSGRTALASNLNTPTSVFSDGTNVYFTEAGLSPASRSSGLRRVSRNGGAVTALRDGEAVVNVMVNGNDLYFSSLNFFDGNIQRMPKSGGAPVTLAIGLQFIARMIVAGDQLYFFNTGDDDTIRKMPLAGGTPTVVQDGIFLTTEFALDECAVYFVDGDLFVRRSPR